MKLIKLTQGKVTMVDDADYDWLNQYKWCAAKNRDAIFYAVNKKLGRMHRFILGLVKGENTILGDHRDRDTLNNQRYNLRIADYSNNAMNVKPKHKYLGVTNRKNGTWRARIRLSNALQNIDLGTFKSEINAAKAYDEAAKKYHGEFANLNFK